ncbi:MAG: PD40 domain-containing protein [Polyangiaceae bacterium]|nr:PD40 domain-containing protein [Polyangiaceae bacterium]
MSRHAVPRPRQYRSRRVGTLALMAAVLGSACLEVKTPDVSALVSARGGAAGTSGGEASGTAGVTEGSGGASVDVGAGGEAGSEGTCRFIAPQDWEERDCGVCGTQIRFCSEFVSGISGTWGNWSECVVRQDAVCQPGETTEPEACGLCGQRQWQCFDDCRYYPLPCTGEGVCAPHELEVVPACPEAGYVRVVECTEECQYSPDWTECRPLTTRAQVKLAFSLDSEGERGALIQNVYGADPARDLPEKSTALTPRLAGRRRAREPRFSPDGRWLAYLADETAEGAWGIYLLDLSGSDARRPLLEVDDSSRSVRSGYGWAGSNGSLLFLAALERAGYYGVYQLRFADDDPGGEVLPPLRLTPAGARISRFAVSPDGSAVAADAAWSLYVASLPRGEAPSEPAEIDSSQLVGEPDREIRAFAWSPSGRMLSVLVDPGLLRLVAVDATAPGAPLLGEVVAMNDGVSRVAWAPDGAALAFDANGRVHVGWLDAIDQPVPLTLPSGTIAELAWSPDGSWLVVAQNPGSDTSGTSKLHAFAIPHRAPGDPIPDLGAPTDLSLAHAMSFGALSFSHDSTRLTVTVTMNGCYEPECGDGVCAAQRGETFANCGADCLVTCGNGRCDLGLPGADEYDPAQGQLCPLDCDGTDGNPAASCVGRSRTSLLDLDDAEPANTARGLPGSDGSRVLWSPDDEYVAYRIGDSLVAIFLADPGLVAVPLHLDHRYSQGLTWRPVVATGE